MENRLTFADVPADEESLFIEYCPKCHSQKEFWCLEEGQGFWRAVDDQDHILVFNAYTRAIIPPSWGV